MSDHPELDELEICRMAIFAYLPWNEPVEYISDWLRGQFPDIPPQALLSLQELHVSDKIVTEWRKDFIEMVEFLYCFS
uniref:Uncharacterized protein n=1 Tax=Leviviridae sp. TaxID=2027243 RepID=A0A514DD90_9VIRU|nr:MAG: hypothetical protein H3Bulk40452_000004 [Leviviridae sp.]